MSSLLFCLKPLVTRKCCHHFCFFFLGRNEIDKEQYCTMDILTSIYLTFSLFVFVFCSTYVPLANFQRFLLEEQEVGMEKSCVIHSIELH